MRRALMVLIAGAALTAHAEPEIAEEESDLPPWAHEQIEPLHEGVSSWVETTSRRIDAFFGTTDALTIENDSYLRINQAWRWQEGDSFQQDIGVRFRLDLPTTEERLRLVIESEPEETQGTLAEQDDQLVDERIRGVESLRIGLNRLGRHDKRERWTTQVGAGVRVRLPPDPYARVITQRLWTLNDGPWQLESDNRLSWFNKDGYSARTRWDVGRPVNENRHLRFITNLQWREEVDHLEFSEAVELNRRIDRRRAIRHSAVVLGESVSDPRIEDTYLQTRYRRDLHRGILFLDLAPALHFPREANREPRWALDLRLEMYFRREIDRVRL
ncbi:hypothetical protein [Halomonas sp. BM-2019]|uniref:hypothetical protein n=1 Tax=Halomonas sp. BM-2019 TaxID=2811227 RepID=UPI0031FCC6AF